MVGLDIALEDRTLQQAADRYADGDRERLQEMWMSGELLAIYAARRLRPCAGMESTPWQTATNMHFAMQLRAHQLIILARSYGALASSGS